MLSTEDRKAEQARLQRNALAFRETKELGLLRTALESALILCASAESWSEERCWSAIMANVAKRDAKVGRFRWLRSAPKGLSRDGQMLRDAINWHAGNGSLWSAHTGGMMFGEVARDRADTLATVLLIIQGIPARAVNAWRGALGR